MRVNGNICVHFLSTKNFHTNVVLGTLPLQSFLRRHKYIEVTQLVSAFTRAFLNFNTV